MTATAHGISRTIAILGGSLLALFAIVAAGVGTVLFLVGVGSVRAAGAPVRRLRRPRSAVVRTPAKARVEPAL